MRYNLNSGYGMLQAAAVNSGLSTFGRFLVVMPTTDVNYGKMAELVTNDVDGNVRLFATLAAAYAAAVSESNDVIFLSAGPSHNVTAGIAWTKNRIHVVGLDGGDRLTDQGAKISGSATDATAYVLNVTGTRNSFRNVKVIQNSTNAAALNVLITSGEGNLYKNCSFIFGVATNLGGTTAQEVTIGEDSGTFINCQFGEDTLLTSAARQVMLVKTVTTEMKSCVFKDCDFKISSSSATATFIRLNAITDILFATIFKNCTFQASVDTVGGIALTGGAVITGTGTNKGTLNFYYPGFFNTVGSLAAGGVNAGVQVVAPISSATAIKGITPTA